MDDIVHRLKEQMNHPSMTTPDLLEEAAAEIEKLRESLSIVATLRKPGQPEDEMERLRHVVIYAAACNMNAVGYDAASVLRQLVKQARDALGVDLARSKPTV